MTISQLWRRRQRMQRSWFWRELAMSYLSDHRKARCDGHPLSSLPTTRSAPRTLKLLSPILPADLFYALGVSCVDRCASFVHIVSAGLRVLFRDA